MKPAQMGKFRPTLEVLEDRALPAVHHALPHAAPVVHHTPAHQVHPKPATRPVHHHVAANPVHPKPPFVIHFGHHLHG
jgi:hypothetical protein